VIFKFIVISSRTAVVTMNPKIDLCKKNRGCLLDRHLCIHEGFRDIDCRCTYGPDTWLVARYLAGVVIRLENVFWGIPELAPVIKTVLFCKREALKTDILRQMFRGQEVKEFGNREEEDPRQRGRLSDGSKDLPTGPRALFP